MKHLFREWDKIKKRSSKKHIMLFLDYDGTLAPIASNPGRAFISKRVKKVLAGLSGRPGCKLAIISGRAIENIMDMVGLGNIIYSGNHGLQIKGPKIKFTMPVSPRYRTILEHIKDDLKEKLCGIRGAFIENKGLSLSLHYRLVDKRSIPKVKSIFRESIIVYLVRNKIKIRTGKMVLEVRPSYEWNKGKVVLWLLSRQRFAAKNQDILSFYIGDDVTDEDAFMALKNKGITVFVGKPKSSCAQYYLKDTGEVLVFLERLLDMRSGAHICQN